MLTPSYGRTDGRKLEYLDQSGRSRSFDPCLFDHLYRYIKVEDKRSVRLVENVDVLPETVFFTQSLTDSVRERCRYFAEMLERFRGVDLVFFDPDNGFEVTSKPLGRRGSIKYLFWEEMARTYLQATRCLYTSASSVKSGSASLGESWK